MTQKTKKTRYSTDEIKHTHREAYKGHKTKKHFLNALEEEEAEKELKEKQTNADT